MIMACMHLHACSAMLLLSICLGARAEHKPDPAKPAAQYPAHVSQNGVTVAADPYSSAARVDVFRVNYLDYNFMPIRLIVTNDTDKPVSLSDARILLLPREGQAVNAGEPEDVERRVSHRDRAGTTIPVGPLKLHTKGKNSDSKVEADFSEYEYSALAVEPHTTRAGFLFYDIEGLGKNPLTGAKFVLRKMRDSDGKEMFAFEVPLDAPPGSGPK